MFHYLISGEDNSAICGIDHNVGLDDEAHGLTEHMRVRSFYVIIPGHPEWGAANIHDQVTDPPGTRPHCGGCVSAAKMLSFNPDFR